jgi:hypothetical protein
MTRKTVRTCSLWSEVVESLTNISIGLEKHNIEGGNIGVVIKEDRQERGRLQGERN